MKCECTIINTEGYGNHFKLRLLMPLGPARRGWLGHIATAPVISRFHVNKSTGTQCKSTIIDKEFYRYRFKPSLFMSLKPARKSNRRIYMCWGIYVSIHSNKKSGTRRKSTAVDKECCRGRFEPRPLTSFNLASITTIRCIKECIYSPCKQKSENAMQI